MSPTPRRLRLPHPSLADVIAELRSNVTGERKCEVDGLEVSYRVCDPWPDEADLAMYDEDGNIYLPERFEIDHPEIAYLIVVHEHVEVTHKLAGRNHAYAHRRALLAELLEAKKMFSEPGQLQTFLKYRIGGYPDWKVRDKRDVEKRLHDLLQAPRPLRGRIIEVVTEARL